MEIRGGTPLSTRKCGKAYAQVRNVIRGGTGSKKAFTGPFVDLFLRGSTVAPRMTICGRAFLFFKVDRGRSGKRAVSFLRGSTGIARTTFIALRGGTV